MLEIPLRNGLNSDFEMLTIESFFSFHFTSICAWHCNLAVNGAPMC